MEALDTIRHSAEIALQKYSSEIVVLTEEEAKASAPVCEGSAHLFFVPEHDMRAAKRTVRAIAQEFEAEIDVAVFAYSTADTRRYFPEIFQKYKSKQVRLSGNWKTAPKKMLTERWITNKHESEPVYGELTIWFKEFRFVFKSWSPPPSNIKLDDDRSHEAA